VSTTESTAPKFTFCLYVAGDTQNSVQARVNLAALCRKYLPDRHEIEVVDVFREPQRTLTEGIFMTPMLIKLGPGPVCRILGTLSDSPTVLRALGLESRPLAA
jgi:circadian clock protein KaiB